MSSNNGRKGLKINNTESSVQQPKTPNSELFEKKAAETFAKIESYKTRMWDLVGRYKSIIEDKILPVNKGSIAKDLEAEILNKLIALASEMNEDDSQPEGLGSTSIIMMLMKMSLLQRDQINMLGFKVEKLEKEFLVSKKDTDKQ